MLGGRRKSAVGDEPGICRCFFRASITIFAARLPGTSKPDAEARGGLRLIVQIERSKAIGVQGYRAAYARSICFAPELLNATKFRAREKKPRAGTNSHESCRFAGRF